MAAQPAAAALAALVLHALVAPAAAGAGALRRSETFGSGICGIASNMLDYNDEGMRTFCDMNIGFWWNWNHAPRNIYSEGASCAWGKFMPMIWGHDRGNGRISHTSAKWLMGYNEPDLWAPPAYPGGDYLASGTFAPTFHCGADELAESWQVTVLAYKKTKPDGYVLSPAMADPAASGSAGDYSGCDAAPQMPDNHMRWCEGWLKCFKASAMRYQCGETNCWDVIDGLQFHAYVYTAEELIKKVKVWEATWADDLNGLNGRTRKKLWLTEFARAGTTDPADPDGKGRSFMTDAVRYMQASPHFDGWSWFSQSNKSFASFEIGGVVPEAPFWASDLIDDSGKLTALGETYKGLCR